MKAKTQLFVFWFILHLFTSHDVKVTAQYSYPVVRPSNAFSYTVFKSRKAIGGNPKFMETYASYTECIKLCSVILYGWCNSISVQIVTNNTAVCSFFDNSSRITIPSNEYFFISKIQRNCSHGCSITVNPCGKCKCHPSCSPQNRRQYICNCTKDAGEARNCRQHFDRGFNKTGIFLVNPNDTPFQTLCEMEKINFQNSVVEQKVCLSVKGVRGAASKSMWVPYCVQWCSSKRNDLKWVEDIVLFDIDSPNCWCALYSNYPGVGFSGSYCFINSSSSDCDLSTTPENKQLYHLQSHLINNISFDQCLKMCKEYWIYNPTENGYFSSGISIKNSQCLCQYGYNNDENTDLNMGCFFQTIPPVQIIESNKSVWIPMMTRFATWEANFWSKSYENYENGFGVINQQWIGLKKLNQITNAFKTDMRVDYSFNGNITFSTIYYNVKVGSSYDNYGFSYDSYDPRSSGEPDRFDANGKKFQSCCNWWAASCNDKLLFPTSIYGIQYGLAKDLLYINFLLRTE